jgi:hypothetical protein
VGVTGGSGKPLAVTVDPSTTNAACSMSDATTVHFDHAGTCVLAAQESGARSGVARAAGPVTQSIVVPQTQQEVAFDSTAPTAPTVDGSYDVAASSTSGRQVTLSVTAPTGACVLSGSAVAFHHVGSCTVTATQAGDADLAPASASQSLTVGQAAQTIAFTSTAPTSVNVGDTYDVSATSTSGGVVSFSSSTPACSVSGTTVTFDASGACTIDADQAGNADYAPAPQVSQSVTVSAEVSAVMSVTATAEALHGNGQQRVTALVTGLPKGSTATLTVSVNSDAHITAPNGCTVQTVVAGQSFSCPVTSDPQTFVFDVTVNKSRPHMLFHLTPTPPLVLAPGSTPDAQVTLGAPPAVADRSFSTRTQR